MWNPKYDKNEHIYKTETDSQKTNLQLPKGKKGDINEEFEISRYKPLYKINNKVLLQSTENYTQ